MSTVKANRTLQYVLIGEFIMNLAADAMLNTAGVLTPFKANAGAAYDAIPLPPNAVLVGGDVTVETASNDSGTATIAVGDSNSAARYLAATSIKAAGRTALVPTGYRGVGENIRLTLANQNGDATAGKLSVRAHYMVTGRANETQIT